MHSLNLDEIQTQKQKTKNIKKSHGLNIGVLKDSFLGETRVSLTPDDCEILINNGNNIVLETGAGLGAGYSDLEYAEIGCKISTKEEVFKQNIILKLSYLTLEETYFLTKNQILISPLSTKFQKKDILENLLLKKITSIFFNHIKDDKGNFIIDNTLGQIEGRASILLAAEAMSKEGLGLGEMLGGITGIMPTEVVVLGANSVGKYAIKSALGLGANVKLFDESLYKLNELKDELGIDISTALINKKTLSKSLMRCNILIFAIKNNLISPLIITEQMVGSMKKGSVIIDLSIDNCSGVETSEMTDYKSPYIVKKNVIHFCVPNISSKYPRTSSILLSSIFSNKLLMLQNMSLEGLLLKDLGLKNGVATYRGFMTNKKISDFFEFDYTNIDLLLY